MLTPAIWLLEKFYWKGLCWCFGYSEYKSILSLSESLPIAYQLIDRDLKFFISIVQGKNCIPFSQYFTRARSNRCLRSGQTVHLAVNACAKKLTAKSYFNRIQTVVNDFNDVLVISIYSTLHWITKVACENSLVICETENLNSIKPVRGQ